MYKIGDFSKITGLSIKALRYYDDEAILIPAYRNEESAYRYYDEKNYKAARAFAAYGASARAHCDASR